MIGWLKRAQAKRSGPSPAEVEADLQERVRLSLQKLEDDRTTALQQVLKGDPIRLYPLDNVAPGTFGYAVRSLERDGLFTSRLVPGILPMEDFWSYEMTEKGRAEAQPPLEQRA